MKDETYYLEEVPTILNRLNENSKPEWGNLTPQHMIEHLVSTWRISNGKSSAPQLTPDEKLPAYRKFLGSDAPFEKNIKNRLMGEGLPALRKKSLQEAKNQLMEEIIDFFAHHKNHPDSKSIHPFFGELDKEGWLKFQEKHMDHHFRQFNLI